MGETGNILDKPIYPEKVRSKLLTSLVKVARSILYSSDVYVLM